MYTDEDVTSELAPAIRTRGLMAQSAVEAGLLNVDDEVHLAYATQQGSVLLTYNARDFLTLAQQYAQGGRSHTGIVVSSEQYSRREFGTLLRQVLRLLNTLTADEMHNRVVYLQQFK